jgi:hypothetical protein
VDGPLDLVTLLAPPTIGQGFGDTWTSVRERIRDSIVDSVEATLATIVTATLDDCLKELVLERAIASVQDQVWDQVWDSVDVSVWSCVKADFTESTWEYMWEHRLDSTSLVHQVRAYVFDSVWAYWDAGWMAYYRFYDHSFFPNDLQALARFNELVSGYWLGEETAILVRRPEPSPLMPRVACTAPRTRVWSISMAGASMPGMGSGCRRRSS